MKKTNQNFKLFELNFYKNKIMSKDDFEFHRRLPLQKITEDLPYRLAGIKREKKIVCESSSESSDEINFKFSINNDCLEDNHKNIKNEYTFRKRKKNFNINKIQKPQISFINRDKINVNHYFNNNSKDFDQINESSNHSKINYGKYYIDDNIPKPEISYSNFDSSKSDGNKNIYPFLTEFDYETEEDKHQRENLESIHISGTVLVPSLCKDLQQSSELKSNSHKQNSMFINTKNEEEEEEKIYKEIENWQNFIQNESYNAEEENSNSNKKDDVSQVSTNSPESIENSTSIQEDSKEASKFKELLKHSKPKPITIDSNLQEKVTNRVTMKKKMTAAIHNSTIASFSHTVLPITWQSAKKSLVVKRHENSLQDYLEIHQNNKLITHNEIESIGKTLKKFEKQRIIAKEKENIPDWAKGASHPILMTAPKKTKIIVKSKFMKEKDYFT